MPRYNLGLEGPDGEKWVEDYETPEEMRRGDRFEYDGYTWQVTEIAVPQSGSSEVLVLRCHAI
jgi:hypothetical protein